MSAPKPPITERTYAAAMLRMRIAYLRARRLYWERQGVAGEDAAQADARDADALERVAAWIEAL